MEVLFCIAKVRLNCLIVVQTSCCPSLVQDEWRGGTYPMQLCAEKRLVCQLQPVLFLLLHSFSAYIDHTNPGWSSTFFQVFLSSWNFPNFPYCVLRRKQKQKTKQKQQKRTKQTKNQPETPKHHNPRIFMNGQSFMWLLTISFTKNLSCIVVDPTGHSAYTN